MSLPSTDSRSYLDVATVVSVIRLEHQAYGVAIREDIESFLEPAGHLARGWRRFTENSAAISSTDGRLSVSDQPATPMGFLTSRSAYVAAQNKVIEEQVDDEVLISDHKGHLPPDKSESGSKFQQKALDMVDKRLLNVALSAQIGGAEEIKQIGVLEDLFGHIGFSRREGVSEVRERIALAFTGRGERPHVGAPLEN